MISARDEGLFVQPPQRWNAEAAAFLKITQQRKPTASMNTQPHLHRAAWPVLLAVSLSSLAPTLGQAQELPNDYNQRYRRYYEIPLGDYYTGRSPYMRPKGDQPAPPPPPRVQMVRQVERPMPQHNCDAITTGLVHMTKRMPAEVTLGQEFMYELNPVAMGCAGNVVVTDRVPAGASYVRSEPPAEVQGDLLVWRLPDMDPGASQNIKVWLKAEQEGRIASCATVRADPRVCAGTVVGKPMLAITKTGPETALLGAEVPYTITVSNTGTAVAKDVVVTDPVPEGFTHSGGQSQLSFQVGDLAPNQSKSIPVSFRADKRGRICNTAVAASSNAGRVNAEACTTIVQPGVKIVKSTDTPELLINRTANYNIVVSNTGDVPLTGVVVTDTAAPETTIVAAEGGTFSGNTARWDVGELGVGQEKQLTLRIASRVPGQFCNTAAVATAQGLRDSSQACSTWIGVTGVLVEVVDDPDPIQVNETTTYTIRVTNQGSTRDIKDLRIVANFPEQTSPTSASGGATVSGKQVSFPVVPTLVPKQSVTYTIVAQGVKSGDSRLTVEVTTADRQNAIVEVESTTVY